VSSRLQLCSSVECDVDRIRDVQIVIRERLGFYFLVVTVWFGLLKVDQLDKLVTEMAGFKK